MIDITTATKLGEILETAANEYRIRMDCQFQYDSFADAVGREFWLAFGKHEQSSLMQEVYSLLCDMGFTPLETLK
jgi:hypothetical protein